MKKKEKLVILVLLIITIALVVVGISIKNNDDKQTAKNNSSDSEVIDSANQTNVALLDDGTQINTSKKLHEAKTLNGIKVTNIQLTENGNISDVLATVTNTKDTVEGGYGVRLVFQDKNGEDVISINGIIKELQPGEVSQFHTSASYDFANVYDFRIEKQ